MSINMCIDTAIKPPLERPAGTVAIITTVCFRCPKNFFLNPSMNFIDTAAEAGTLVDSGLGSDPDIPRMENIG
jgi:hypothetical protein